MLFISLSCVGDAVMTTPLLQSLHNHYPDARIDIVGDRRSSLLFSRCPFAGEIVNKDKSRPGRGVFELLGRLRHKRYDIIVDVRTELLAYLLRANRRYTRLRARPYGAHAVEQMMGVMREIHGDDPIPPARLWTDAADRRQAGELLYPLDAGRWLALAAGAGGRAAKTWPQDRYAALANNLAGDFNGVILLGTESDQAVTAAIGRRLDIPFVDLAGKTTLLQVAAVLERSAFFVGSDSGLGHVAAGVATPTLTLFSVDQPERVRPWGNQAVWLQGDNNDARNIALADAEAKIRPCL
jgi:ADP-heptose:LPS heptosyltransferase